MLDMPSPSGFQKYRPINLSPTEHVKPCGSNWVKIKEAQLKISLHSRIVHRILIKMVEEL